MAANRGNLLTVPGNLYELLLDAPLWRSDGESLPVLVQAAVPAPRPLDSLEAVAAEVDPSQVQVGLTGPGVGAGPPGLGHALALAAGNRAGVAYPCQLLDQTAAGAAGSARMDGAAGGGAGSPVVAILARGTVRWTAAYADTGHTLGIVTAAAPWQAVLPLAQRAAPGAFPRRSVFQPRLLVGVPLAAARLSGPPAAGIQQVFLAAVVVVQGVLVQQTSARVVGQIVQME